MKRLFTSIFVLALTLAGTMHSEAQVKQMFGVANHLGVDVNVGTTGIGAEVSTPLTTFIQARAGVSIMPGFDFHVNTTVSGTESVNGMAQDWSSDMKVKGSLSRVQGSLIFNIYPFTSRVPFFVAAGAYFGGRELVKISGQLSDYNNIPNLKDAGVEIGDYKLPLGPNGEVNGALRVNGFRPYFAIGTGRPCPKGRVGFMWELGVQLQKKAYVWDDINKSEVSLSGVDSDDTFQKVMDNFRVYPVLKFTISGRIF